MGVIGVWLLQGICALAREKSVDPAAMLMCVISLVGHLVEGTVSLTDMHDRRIFWEQPVLLWVLIVMPTCEYRLGLLVV